MLEQVPYLSFLWRQIDPSAAVKEDSIIPSDLPPVRPHKPGHSLEGHALPAAGGPQYAQASALRLKAKIQVKIFQLF